MKDINLNTIPLFANLGSREQREITKTLQAETYRRNQVLFSTTEESDTLYIVEDGWVSLSADGNNTLANLGPGSLIGEVDFFQGSPRSMTAKATTDTKTWVLDSASLQQLINQNPQIGFSLAQSLGKTVVQMTPYLEKHLRQVSPFNTLADEDRLALARHLIPHQIPNNEFIFHVDDAPTGLFILEEGTVRLMGDHETDYHELQTGQSFGEMSLLTSKNHSHTAQTVSECVLWQLTPQDFARLSQDHPAIRTALSQNLTARLSNSDQAEAVDILHQVQLFSELSPQALHDTASHLMLRHVPQGEIIFQVDDPGDALFIIDGGEVDLQNAQGQISRRLKQGETFGEMALLTGKTRTETAIAGRNTNLWALYRQDFDALLVKHPKLSSALSQSLQEHLNTADGSFIEKHLQKLATLGGLSRMQLDEISARLHAKRYTAGDLVYQEGQPGQELYFIENGRIERFASAQVGVVPLPALESGDFLGESSLLSGRAHTETARAQIDCDVWVLGKTDFEELVYKYPNLSTVLNRIMSDRLVETMEILRNVRPQQPAALPQPTTGSYNPQQRQSSRRVPPVNVRPVPPPPFARSRGSRPVNRSVPPTMGGNGRRQAQTSRPAAVPTPPPQAKAPSQQARPASKASPKANNGTGKRPKQRVAVADPQAQRQQKNASGNIARGANTVGQRLKNRFDGLSEWFINISLSVRVGLVFLTLLVIWMCGIAAPATMISALAASIIGEDGTLLVDGPPANGILNTGQTGMIAALPFVETTTPTPTPTGIPSSTPTPSPTVTNTPIPTFTHTPTPTPTPEDTPTPTATPTETPTPTNTPIPATNTPVRPAAPAAPPDTPTPEPTPTPDADFVVTKVRKLTPCENQGNHHIYIRVVDVNGAGLNNVPVKIAWGPNSQDNVIAKTEAKDRGNGFIEFAMFKGTYNVEVMGAKSQVASGITPDFQQDEPCVESGNAVGNSLFHASFEVVFQRTY